MPENRVLLSSKPTAASPSTTRTTISVTAQTPGAAAAPGAGELVDQPIRCHPFRLELDSLLPLYGTAHQVGTTRFGTDPKSSVLDPFCKAHELDNLYVVDSSFFVSAAAVNPTLTIVANAMRVGDHLKQRMA